jgi:glycosyltransferase involved in cell wall biosynthesis
VARLVLMSFRLGGTDGVSIEAAKWKSALEQLGHRVHEVAGEGPVDVLVPGLAIGAARPPTLEQLQNAIRGADLVIVENLASLPLNVAAREVLYQALDGRAALFHHHDLPWQREHLAHLEGPRDQPRWRHVTINELSRRQLRERGIEATTLMNSFDCSPPRGNRERTRRALGLTGEVLVLLPTRAVPRKNVEGALELAQSLEAVLWLLGPAEDGYGPQLEGLLAATSVEVRRGLSDGTNVHDAYAACDLVVMPSTWEGFGNPVLESVTHRRPLALHRYPVAREIISYGFEFFKLSDVAAIKESLASPDEGLLTRNLEVAREHFNVANLPARLVEVLEPDMTSISEPETVRLD